MLRVALMSLLCSWFNTFIILLSSFCVSVWDMSPAVCKKQYLSCLWVWSIHDNNSTTFICLFNYIWIVPEIVNGPSFSMVEISVVCSSLCWSHQFGFYSELYNESIWCKDPVWHWNHQEGPYIVSFLVVFVWWYVMKISLFINGLERWQLFSSQLCDATL